MNRAITGIAVVMIAAAVAAAEDKPRVLILGDSISIGYTPHVMKVLADEAVVVRPKGNCQGTNHGVKHIDKWLALGGGNWDVIHFNFGLHDLKRVKPDSGKNSNDPNDPRQAAPERYEKQLREITTKLKATGAKLVFATTTPYPSGVQPHGDPDDAIRYNELAMKIAEEADASLDDLYSFVKPRLKELQRPVNVHFTREGSRQLAAQVAKSIRAALAGTPNNNSSSLREDRTQ